jgi:PAS domain S-box-containing protein
MGGGADAAERSRSIPGADGAVAGTWNATTTAPGRTLCVPPQSVHSGVVLRRMGSPEPTVVGDQFALLVSSVTDYAIFMLDPAGVIVTWNEGAQRIKGYRADEIIGRHFSVFYPADDARNRKPDWELEIAKREGRYEEEGWRIRKDGSRFWASVVITALRDQTGRLRGFGKVTRDMTERHELEERRNFERATEAARLREHANRMAELERTKTQFLNLASHELRGPMTVLRGYNSMLRDGSIPMQEIPRVARLLETKLAQMDMLIEQMLETARLETDSVDVFRQVFDLGDLAREQVELFEPLADGHHLVLSADPAPVEVAGDRPRIATVIANFLDNALKYSPAGGEICVSTGRRDSIAFLSVRDEGLGITPEHLPMLFSRFGRLPTEENVAIRGTGLGLFLCKEIANRHGGDVSVQSKPGVGSEFTLTLPLREHRPAR